MSTHPTQTPLSNTNTTAPVETTTTTTTTTTHKPNNGGLVDKARSAAAAVHGTGEAVRGRFNSAVDEAVGDVSPPSLLSQPKHPRARGFTRSDPIRTRS
ncbi:hypothetical protein V494_04346 [Pseudogymnoascus sp. VKM F-4513 (FW-928)]|nr:hypothetical protein V494_04346 [Pseudogymnoascus sp. VKM F-4513 (FW-928)]